MSHLFITILSALICLLPPPALAGDDVDQEAEILRLHEGYNASFKEGDTDAALKFAEQMYALTPKVYGKISDAHAAAALHLAEMRGYQNLYYEAIQFYQEYLYITKKMKVPKDKLYLSVLEGLTLVYHISGDDKRTIIYAWKTLKLAKKLKLPKGEIGDYELALGLYYTHIYGKRAEAKTHLKIAYDLFYKSYGENHNKTVSAVFWQGRNLLNYGQNRKAAIMFENALAAYKNILEYDDRRITNIYSYLVDTYENMNEGDKATIHCIAYAMARPENKRGYVYLLYKIAPNYPVTARRHEKGGYVIGKFTVDEEGRVKDIKIIETTDKVFNDEAVSALSKFRYAPSIKDGKPVKAFDVLHKMSFVMKN